LIIGFLRFDLWFVLYTIPIVGVLAKLLSSLLFFNPNKYKASGEKLVLFLTFNGVLFIKLGQVLATRSDLFDQETLKQLIKLQDQNKARPYHQIKKQLNKTWDQEQHWSLIDKIEEVAVASASIGQTHKVWLKSGQVLAVKVLHDNVIRDVKNDLRLLAMIVIILQKLLPKRLKLKEVVTTLKQSVDFEVDLRLEAAACDEMRENSQDMAGIIVPHVFWPLTSATTIATSWIDGYRIDNLPSHLQNSIEKREVLRLLANSFFYHVFQYGFFHADLHAGNILITNDGQVALLDFGITGRLDPSTRYFMLELFHGFLVEDYQKVADVHFKTGYINNVEDIPSFAQACRAIAKPMIHQKQLSISVLLTQLFNITAIFNMYTQPQLLLLQKSLIIIEGIGQQLDPDCTMWKLAEDSILNFYKSHSKYGLEKQKEVGRFYLYKNQLMLRNLIKLIERLTS
jgi:ubiquinone biosynthesis protein